MTHSLYQADELPLIGRQLDVAAAKGRLKKASGPDPWCSTAPKPVLEASQCTTNCRSKSGVDAP